MAILICLLCLIILHKNYATYVIYFILSFSSLLNLYQVALLGITLIHLYFNSLNIKLLIKKEIIISK